MTAAAGLLGFGAVADGSLADYDGFYANSLAETVAASDASSAVAAFANDLTETGLAGHASSNVAIFGPLAIENSAANDTASSLSVFVATSSNAAAVNDNASSTFVANSARSEAGAASDELYSTGDLVAWTAEASLAETSTTVDIGISIVEGGPQLDLNEDSLLGFGAIGGGALAAYGGSIVEVSRDNISVAATYNPLIADTLFAYDAIIPSNIITFALLDTLSVSDSSVGEYGFNFSYADTEIMCVRSEPRMMRVSAQWKASVDPEEQDARANPDYKPRAKHRKRAC